MYDRSRAGLDTVSYSARCLCTRGNVSTKSARGSEASFSPGPRSRWWQTIATRIKKVPRNCLGRKAAWFIRFPERSTAAKVAVTSRTVGLPPAALDYPHPKFFFRRMCNLGPLESWQVASIQCRPAAHRVTLGGRPGRQASTGSLKMMTASSRGWTKSPGDR